MHARHALAIALLLGSAACGGTAVIVNPDGGTTTDAPTPGVDGSSDTSPLADARVDSPGPPPGVFCSGQPCASGQYCIHPGAVIGCAQCSALPPDGMCPPPSYPTMDASNCGALPAPGDGGYWCVTPPPPQQPPFCSDTIPASCVSPTVQGLDVTCASLACG